MHRREPAFARPARWAVVGLLASLVLAGCSDADDDGGLAEAGPTVTASASPSPTPTAEPTTEPEAGTEPPAEGLVIGSINADGAEEQALADLTIDYWSMLYQMYAEAEVDRGAFSLLAKGRAYQDPVSYVDQLRSSDLRQQGGAVMHVEDVTVSGRSAEVVSCFWNQALNVNADGRPAESVLPFFQIRNVLTKQGPDWRVARSITISENQRCKS